jgi:hypothetical protein
LSFVSHTPLVHVSAPAPVVHVPFKVGFVCGGSVGTTMPLGNVGTQVFIDSLHHIPIMQSASTLQPPAGPQRPFMLHVAERQTVLPFVIVHGPSPFA